MATIGQKDKMRDLDAIDQIHEASVWILMPDSIFISADFTLYVGGRVGVTSDALLRAKTDTVCMQTVSI